MAPLHYAASHGQTSTVELLLSRGADVNGVAAKDGWCALHYAADKGHLDVIKVLVSAGADVDNRAADWQTPLHCAAKMVHPQAILLLCKLGANQNALEKFGQSPLRLAIHWRKEDSVEALMKARPCSFSAHDADVEFQGSGRWKGVPDDLARDTRIRQMLQRQWPKEEEGPEERGRLEEEGVPEDEAGSEDRDTPKISVPASYAHDFGGSPLIPFMLFLLIILLLLNLIHGLY
ncbi:ankyrin [Schizophyllum commune Tattone D]|nr:ankyrin [Schizophyllum commune Tattone D]